MQPLLPDHQVRHLADPVELRHLPVRPALVHLRVQLLQAQDLPALYLQGVDTGPSIVSGSPRHALEIIRCPLARRDLGDVFAEEGTNDVALYTSSSRAQRGRSRAVHVAFLTGFHPPPEHLSTSPNTPDHAATTPNTSIKPRLPSLHIHSSSNLSIDPRPQKRNPFTTVQCSTSSGGQCNLSPPHPIHGEKKKSRLTMTKTPGRGYWSAKTNDQKTSSTIPEMDIGTSLTALETW